MSFPQADPASSVRPPHVEWYTVRASSPRYRTTTPRVRSAASRKTAATPSIPSNTWSSTLATTSYAGSRGFAAAPTAYVRTATASAASASGWNRGGGLPADHGGDVRLQRHHGDGEQLPFPREEADPSGHFPAPDAQVRRPRRVEGVAEEPRPVPPDPFPDRGQGDATRRFGGQPPVDAPRPDRLPFEDDSRRPSREEHADEPGPRRLGGRRHDGTGTGGDPRPRRRRAGGRRATPGGATRCAGSRGGAPAQPERRRSAATAALQQRVGSACIPYPAGGVVPPGGAGVTIFAICMNGVSRSIGTGKMVVELFSAATSRSVWR